tara:strand:+ start:1199 stop:1960 length:762 start_codon:yes stop_codon:yes gene_type:complete
MYKTNGSTHYEGIANEHAVIELLNNRNYFDCPVTHLGGTKNKADAMAGSVPISIKRKKGLANGSFDWINTSSTNGIIDRTVFTDFFKFVKYSRENSIECDITEVRDWYNKCCEAALSKITPSQVTDFLQRQVCDKQAGFKLVIADTDKDTLFIIDHERTPLAQLLSKGYTANVVMGKGKSSAKIIFSAPGKDINDIGSGVDIGLRIRCTSNNGINAMLGLSKANKNSQTVIKIQQDQVQQFVNDSSPTIVFAD